MGKASGKFSRKSQLIPRQVFHLRLGLFFRSCPFSEQAEILALASPEVRRAAEFFVFSVVRI